MSAYIAKAIRGEKPHSSISNWVEILSSDKYRENDYDGIPELVESVNLQASEGPAEASRAIRKKLKYGNVHIQLRALTILKALVENCNPRFQTTFADDMLVHRLKDMASDPLTDEGVRKKLMSLLATWHRQFKDDPKMIMVAGLWASCGGGTRRPAPARPTSPPTSPRHVDVHEQLAREREERKSKEREEKRKERERKEKEKADKRKPATTTRPRKAFNYEQEKPQIVTTIANASQMAIQLTNALKLVNREREKIQDNARVQECLENAKASRKSVVRYIQRVENEELIGTLLDVNERIITALQLYDQMLKSADHDSDEELHKAASQMHDLSLTSDEFGSTNRRNSHPESELSKLQGKQRAAIQRSISRSSLDVNHMGVSRPAPSKNLHPDLRDLHWGGSLDQDATGSLPPPIRPRSAADQQHGDAYDHTLSDYSDYSSSEGESHASPSTARTSATHHDSGPSRGSRDYAEFIDDDDEVADRGVARKGLLEKDDDPFADPFADNEAVSDVGTPGIEKKRMDWS